MEVWLVSSSLPLHCNFYGITTTPPPSLFQRPSFFQSPSFKLRFTTTRSSSSSSSSPITIIPSAKQKVATRDMRIDFGRYKGKMLGSLPSTYLKWVSTNLRERDYQHWADLADQVLADPVYRDRIEWEFAHNLLNGNTNTNNVLSDGGKVSELLADISERFGWDNDDKLGWSRIDFSLLGTSKGGRIPRVSPSPDKAPRIPNKNVLVVKKETVTRISSEDAGNNGVDSTGSNKRSDRRERLRMKRSSESGREEKTRTGLGLGLEGYGFWGVDEENTSGDDHVMINDNHPVNTSPFPGRDSLLLFNKIRHSSTFATRRNKGQSPHPKK